VNEEGTEGREERGRRGVHLFAPNSVPSGSGQNFCPEIFSGWLGQRRCAASSARRGGEGVELSGQWKGRSLAGGIRMAGRGWTPTAKTGGAGECRPPPSVAGGAQQQADQQTSHRFPPKAGTQEWPCSPKPRRTLESPVDTREQQPLPSHATPAPLFVQYCALALSRCRTHCSQNCTENWFLNVFECFVLGTQLLDKPLSRSGIHRPVFGPH